MSYGPAVAGLALIGLPILILTVLIRAVEALGWGPVAIWLDMFRTGSILGAVLLALLLLWGLGSRLLGRR